MGEAFRAETKGATMKRAQGMDWAEKEVCKRLSEGWRYDALAMGSGEALDLLRKEHARAVRVAKKAERMGLRKVLDTDTNEYLEGYQQATNDILTALQRGRGGKE